MLETNPQMQQMMQNAMSNPAMVEMALNSNPQMRAMADANPQMRQMLQNPQFLQVIICYCCTLDISIYLKMPKQSMMNPQALRAVGQQVYFTLKCGAFLLIVFQMAGLGINPTQPMSAFPGQMLPPQLASLAPTRQNLEQQVQTLDTCVPPLPLLICPAQFASQLQQLEAMGFTNRDQNLQALELTGGNVEAAVDRILSGNFN